MKVLVVVDMQNDFINGSLGTDEAKNIVLNVAKKINDYENENGEIIFTRDTHFDNYLNTSEGKNLPVEHCIKNTSGWQICDKIICNNKKIIDKNTFGSFELGEYIDSINEKIESIELVGLCTDICVISNALILKAKFPEIPIIVDASCCAGVSPDSHKNAIDAMKICQIQIIGE